jgi:outer membrane cobalamin receptor
MRYAIATLLFFWLCFGTTFAQEQNLYRLSIEEMQDSDSLDSYTNIATQTLLELRQAPGIVSVLSRREIENSGARDLLDLLRLIPGFNFGHDVNGVIGLGMRGNWAHEGKVLLMIDGLEMTELIYATNQFGNHYSPDQIERIEIIRGPGSAIYGGAAAYAVINIVTRAAENFNALEATQTVGTMETPNTVRQNFVANMGKNTNQGRFYGSTFLGRALRSNQTYTDLLGQSIDLTRNSALRTFNARAGFAHKGLEIKGLWDSYQHETRTGLSYLRPALYERNFQKAIIEAKYIWQVNEKLKIVPKVNYTYCNPWFYRTEDSLSKAFENVENCRRFRTNVVAFYEPTDFINLTFGAEHYRDRAFYRNGFFNDDRWISFNNTALFSQLLWNTPFFNLTLGARYDNHSFYQSVFVPRMGITKAWTNWHVKLLYSNSFRAPAIQNIGFSINQSILPEKTNVLELEAGYQISKRFSITANLYDITTNDPITYLVLSDTEEGYANYPQTGTQGAELELKYRFDRGSVYAAYAFYTAGNKPILDTYRINDDIDNQHIGLAPHKLSMQAHYRLYQGLQINLSSTFLGSRWAFTQELPDGQLVATQQDAALLLNAFLMYKNFIRDGVVVSFGVQDMLNAAPAFIQPYDGAHAPYPTTTREWVVRLNYTIGW